MMRAGRWLLLGLLLTAPLFAAPGCSLGNKEGPEVTCGDLACGRINACQDGVIAQCLDGQIVRYHVCFPNGRDICEEDWQIPGQYRCLEFATDCEGCRPDRVAGCAAFAGAAGGGEGVGGEGASGGAGGDIP